MRRGAHGLSGDGKKRAFVVCGPTASGKSGLADSVADALTEAYGCWAPTLVVDSMQVYTEVPIITNQGRGRPAGLVGIVSVTEDWTVARHKRAVEEATRGLSVPFVLDAGTGMYLNAVLLGVPLAPRVPPHVRESAEKLSLSVGAANPRRAARATELRMAGAPERGSIWDGEPLYDSTLIYLRPERTLLDENIARRSRKIARDGLEEARTLVGLERRGEVPNPSVRDSIGVRELADHASGEVALGEAERRIAARTRRLARRQTRWFDKLTKTLKGRADMVVAETPRDPRIARLMHDIMLT